ncbi:MAG: HAMP domain-containing histidine kinase [Actinomycetota bacterium]|nr:HAMP domain-containing histidine kinase [Actinomycetota bacterium]
MSAEQVGDRQSRRSIGQLALGVLAHPRSGGSQLEYAATFLGCVGVLGLVLVGEYFLENNPTLQGFALLSILVATWRLPARLSALVAGLAAALPFVSVDLGSLDTLTARFQLISTVVTACLAEFTVRAILQAYRERTALLDVLVRFTADAAHELRSPITAIQTVAEVALSQPRDQHEYRRSLETVLRSSRQLIRLTDALLLLASEDAGALTVSGDPVDVSDLVEEALDRWRKRAADSGVGLEGPATLPQGSVSGDEVLLGRLLDNLLENAIRHAGPAGRVSVDLGGASADGWTIVVSDSGPGFDREFRPRAFERFTRAEKHRSRDGGGAGLGLPLCAAIASAHGGSVKIDGSVTGARLRVWLPATRTSGVVQQRRAG